MGEANWDDLRFFLALVQAGTLSGAAKALRVEHTTVARRIDGLERAFAVRLFDRLAKGWVLTSEGTALVPLARTVEEQMFALQRAARGAASLNGVVRVSGPPALVTYFLAPRLRDALQRYPGVALELMGESQWVDLARREADIAVRHARPTAQGMATRLLTTMAYALYGSAAYLSAREPPEWEFLGYTDGLRDLPQQIWLDKFVGTRRFVLRSNEQGTLAQAASSGLGLTVLPCLLADQLPGLVKAEAVDCPVTRKLWMVMHEDVRRSARVRKIADEISTLFDLD